MLTGRRLLLAHSTFTLSSVLELGLSFAALMLTYSNALTLCSTCSRVLGLDVQELDTAMKHRMVEVAILGYLDKSRDSTLDTASDDTSVYDLYVYAVVEIRVVGDMATAPGETNLYDGYKLDAELTACYVPCMAGHIDLLHGMIVDGAWAADGTYV